MPVGARPWRARKRGAPSGSRVQAPPARVNASAVRDWQPTEHALPGTRQTWLSSARSRCIRAGGRQLPRPSASASRCPVMLMLRARESRAGRPVPGFIVVIAQRVAASHRTPRRCPPAPPAPPGGGLGRLALTTIPLQSRPARGPPNPRSPGRATSRPFFLLSVCDRTALAYSQNNHNAQRASRRSGLVDLHNPLVDRGGPRPESGARASRVARRPVAAAAAPAPARAP